MTFIPGWVRALILALVLVILWAIVHAYNGWQQGIGEDRVRAEWAAADEARLQQAQDTAQRMRDLQRQAELRYVVQRDAQDRWMVTTVKEIHDAAAPLAACPVPADVRLRLNAAAGCARGDPAAACGADDAVPGAR